METKEQRPFIAICNNFIENKYIIIDTNIVKLVQSIKQDESLYSVVKKCIENFNFTEALGIAITDNLKEPKNFSMPEQNEEIVALCFTLLQQIVDNKIDSEAFMDKHFLYDGTIDEVYTNFGHHFILPFRDAMLALESEQSMELSKINGANGNAVKDDTEIKNILKDIENEVEYDFRVRVDKKDEIKYYISALKESLRLNNKIIIEAISRVLLEKIEKIKSIHELYYKLLDFYQAL